MHKIQFLRLFKVERHYFQIIIHGWAWFHGRIFEHDSLKFKYDHPENDSNKNGTKNGEQKCFRQNWKYVNKNSVHHCWAWFHRLIFARDSLKCKYDHPENDNKKNGTENGKKRCFRQNWKFVNNSKTYLTHGRPTAFSANWRRTPGRRKVLIIKQILRQTPGWRSLENKTKIKTNARSCNQTNFV